MKTLKISGKLGESNIFAGESIKNLSSYIPTKKIVFITDTNVYKLYKNIFPKNIPTIKIGLGETIKTTETIKKIYNDFLNLEVDRSSFIVGIGGGIVCDITGFAASTFMRGISFGFVATTLLAQVDASIGGKNGVNFKGYKNIIGTFNQPKFVLCDIDLLKTLPQKEISCGLAEIVKHAAISNFNYFKFLEENYKNILALKKNIIEKTLYESLVIKSSIVSKDEREKGERKKLNFGHTIGHAIEKTIGIPHGEAVSIGMAFALKLSVLKGLIDKNKAQRIKKLLINLKLPVNIDIDNRLITDALKKDKKRENDFIHFVILKDIGKSQIIKINIQELEKIINMNFK